MTDRAAPGYQQFNPPRGEINGSAKLDEADVQYIRTSPVATGKLAAFFGVNRSTIQRVRNGGLWVRAPIQRAEFREYLWMPLTWSGCWYWIGATRLSANKREERPILVVGGKNRNAAREFYKHYNGPIGSGLSVCHTCDVPLCVNPAHLFVGTHGDNMRDMVRKGRHYAQRRKAEATC